MYVIDLDSDGLSEAKRDAGLKGWVYVGETSIAIEQRFQQHKSGARNKRGPLYNKAARDHGVGLNRGLPPDTYYSAEAAKEAEARLACELGNKGYEVTGGH